MLGAYRDVGRLVFSQEHGFISINDLGRYHEQQPNARHGDGAFAVRVAVQGSPQCALPENLRPVPTTRKTPKDGISGGD
jgi:hypothetical protein